MLSLEERLRALTVADQDPQLTSDEILMLMDSYPLHSKFSSWKASTPYAVGSLVVPSPRSGVVFRAAVAGTSGSSQPNWASTTITDSGVSWEASELYVDFYFNVNRAIARGWLLKAGKCANRYAFKTDVTTLQRDQMYKQCMDQYKAYKNGNIGSIGIVTTNTFRFRPVIGNLDPSP